MLKRISNFDKHKNDDLHIEEINHLPDKEKVEAIAENFNKISQEYKEVDPEAIEIPEIPTGSTPKFFPWQIKQYIEKVKTNKATLPGDIPARIVKNCSDILCIPMTHMINHSIETGSWQSGIGCVVARYRPGSLSIKPAVDQSFQLPRTICRCPAL